MTVLPQVDHYLAIREQRTDLEEHLAQASQAPALTPEYATAAVAKEKQLAALRNREVDETHVAELRSWLVSSARGSGCTVRRIDLGNAKNRPWAVDDTPLAVSPDEPKGDRRTPFDLQTRTVSLSVTGTTDEVRTLLKTIDDDHRLKHTHLLDLRPSPRGGGELQLDISLKYFALVKPTVG